MKIFRDKTDYDGTVVALGNFDGLHIAHMTIIRNGIKYAKENGLKSGVLLFEENTNDVVGHKIELITPNEAKLELLEREKPDFVYMEKFDKEFMKKTPEEFVQYLVENLHIKAVCVGYDYSFGYKAQGDVKLLKWFGEKYGFKVFVTDVIKLDGKIVSSTYIRSIIKAGDMEKAERFGDKIKALRKNHDVTLSDMAMLINLKSKGSLSTLENAKNPPSYETLINIADVFAVKVDWLIGRSSQPYDEEIIFKLENQIMNFRLSADAVFKDIVPDVYADAELRSKTVSYTHLTLPTNSLV